MLFTLLLQITADDGDAWWFIIHRYRLYPLQLDKYSLMDDKNFWNYTDFDLIGEQIVELLFSISNPQQVGYIEQDIDTENRSRNAGILFKMESIVEVAGSTWYIFGIFYLQA